VRTEKRFTPKLLDRFLREGRGTGTYESYIPHHRVSRSDPASMGRSHLMNWRGRQRELLSDGEWSGLTFASHLKNLLDLVEQFPLSIRPAKFELCRWDVRARETEYPGTEALAKKLGIRHPMVHDKDDHAIWIPTTDLLLVLLNGGGFLELLAVSWKPGSFSDLSKRAVDLLRLEKTYWEVRGVRWLLITSETYAKSVALTLLRTSSWGLADESPDSHIQLACTVARAMCDSSQTLVTSQLAHELGGDQYPAQKALWQAIWRGELPIDLHRGWRPHQPLSHISSAEFVSLNPIASGRTAWI